MNSILASLLLAAIGAALTYLGSGLRRGLRDRRLRHKFPVGGRFVSEYEDRSGGSIVKTKALSALRQKGRQVTGTTTDLKDGRAWALRGTIEPGGFLHGVYEASDPHDSGIGTFFLKVEGIDGDMHGLWGGYDSVNADITGGSYTFRRCPEVTVKPASADDAARVCGLLGDALGDFYVDVSTVRQAIVDDENATCLVAVDSANHLIGAATLHLVDRSTIARFIPVGQQAICDRLHVLRFHERVGLLRAIAVRASYRDRGVGTELTTAGANWCAAKGATAMLAFGWSSPQGCHIAGVMDATQFEQVAELENYWTEDSKAKHYLCPACGPICSCSAVVYSKALDVRSPAVA
jgi:GNAT superfamily N-acetyltransferase